jgi:hypothetical protein
LALEGQGSPRAVWSARQILVDGVALARGWDSLGDPDGTLSRDRLPAVAANADGRLELVVTGGAVWHTWQGELRGDWSGWHSLERPPGSGSAIGGSALAPNQDGRLELFTKLSDGTLWHRWQTGPGRGPWHAWRSLERPGGSGFGSPGAPPALASNHDGRLELVTVADDGMLWHRWQTVPNGGWSAWSSLEAPEPGLVGEPRVASNQDGRLELFTATADGGVWHRWQTGPGRGPWSDWHWKGQSGTSFSDLLAVGAHADGRLVLLALAPTADGDLEVWHREQTEPNDGWTRWKSFGSPAKVFAPLEAISEGLDRIGPPTLVHDGQRRLRLWSLAPGLVEGRITKFYNLAQRLPSGDEWAHGISLFSPPPDPHPAYIPQPAGSPPA